MSLSMTSSMTMLRSWRCAIVVLCILILPTAFRLRGSLERPAESPPEGTKPESQSRQSRLRRPSVNDTLKLKLQQVHNFTLVLHANVREEVTSFVDAVLTSDCVVILPVLGPPNTSQYKHSSTTDELEVWISGSSTATTSERLLEVLDELTEKFEKVFINHPLGYSPSFLQGLFEMEKRYISISHDYAWMLDRWQATYAELRTHQGAARNYAFKKILPKVEMKAQTASTSTLLGILENFKSLQVVPMPEYLSAGAVDSSDELVLGVVGNLSMTDSEAVLRVSRARLLTENPCPKFQIGPRYIELGQWRLGQYDEKHFSIAHADGFTAAIYRADGSAHFGPRQDFSTWQAATCEELQVVSGNNFVQVGAWRLGVSQGNLVLSHQLNSSYPLVLGKAKVPETMPEDLWDRAIGGSNVVASNDLLKIGEWLLRYKDRELVLLHEKHGGVQTFRSDGQAERIKEPVSAYPSLSPPAWCAVPNGKRVKVVVFGRASSSCGANDNLVMEPFKNIEEFNSQLRRFRPNVLLVPTTWPDTYSYSLSLAMRTNLPIIVRRLDSDFDSAIFERAGQYNATFFHDFSDGASVVSLANRIKASSLRKVSPVLEVPREWRHLLRPRLFNVVLVASKIITSKRPLSYTPARSRFTVEERLEQTFETIASIRAHMPDSFIVLIDNSHLDAVQKSRLLAAVDIFVNDENNQTLRNATDEADAKQLGESMLLLQGLDAVSEQQVMFKQLFKLTGRYLLNDQFKYDTFSASNNVFKLASLGKSVDMHKDYYAYTCFFNINAQYLDSFRRALGKIVSDLTTMIASNIPTILHDDVESRLSLMLPDVKYVPNLGVTQRVSTWETPDKDI